MDEAKHAERMIGPGLPDKVRGKAKRAIGELTGRPDLVIEGEAQETGLPPEDSAPSHDGIAGISDAATGR